jgi:hypothetical protein
VRFIQRLSVIFLGLLLLLPGWATIPGQTATAPGKEVNPTDREGILDQLAPEGGPPHSLTLEPRSGRGQFGCS